MNFKQWLKLQEDQAPVMGMGGGSQNPTQVNNTMHKVVNTATEMPGFKKLITTRNPVQQQTAAVDLVSQATKKQSAQNPGTQPIPQVQAVNTLLGQLNAPPIGQKPGAIGAAPGMQGV